MASWAAISQLQCHMIHRARALLHPYPAPFVAPSPDALQPRHCEATNIAVYLHGNYWEAFILFQHRFPILQRVDWWSKTVRSVDADESSGWAKSRHLAKPVVLPFRFIQTWAKAEVKMTKTLNAMHTRCCKKRNKRDSGPSLGTLPGFYLIPFLRSFYASWFIWLRF